MGQDNHAQIAHDRDQVYDEEYSEEWCLQQRVVRDACDNELGNVGPSRKIVILHEFHLRNLDKV